VYKCEPGTGKAVPRVLRMTAYAYRQVETALAHVFRVDVEFQTRAFRGRINHLQRLGLPMGVNPGRGRKIDYSREQICQWLLALEFSEFGMDPKIIVAMIQREWKDLARFIRQAIDEESSAGNDVVLVLVPAQMSDPWRTGARSLTPNTPRLGMFRLNQPNITIPHGTLYPEPFWSWVAAKPRLSLVNLTNRIVALDEALKASQS
jgi:hypothetical protein